jgi:nucleosome binding factor SPN SPT16 subunit
LRRIDQETSEVQRKNITPYSFFRNVLQVPLLSDPTRTVPQQDRQTAATDTDQESEDEEEEESEASVTSGGEESADSDEDETSYEDVDDIPRTPTPPPPSTTTRAGRQVRPPNRYTP